ncbi:unnamed protein product [Echinostoma caproni]|uniref:BRO1 domain-containing protein n=1 Tax=Echinostoma caproni TaxID=27848 RepID=A0A3P8L9C9_9TREM|nr:unnamed protein product [Echinostoma caproni]
MVAYFTGLNEESEQKYGKSIAWFQLAEKRITEAEKLVKDLKESETTNAPHVHGGPLRTNVQFVAEAVRFKLPRLIKDNDFIYHESVPAAETLEPVKGRFR